jgi:acylphosphatase
MEIQGREPMIHKLQEGLNRNSFIEIEWIDTENIPVEPESCFYVR